MSSHTDILLAYLKQLSSFIEMVPSSRSRVTTAAFSFNSFTISTSIADTDFYKRSQ